MKAALSPESAVAQVRCLPLIGAVNCRDLGGYVAAGGRRVRWGRLFRSDQLADLSDADLDVLASTGICTLCDLRGEPERLHRPNRELPGLRALHPIGFVPYRGEELLTRAKAGAISVDEIEMMVREIYRRFVSEQSVVFAKLLELIADDALPLLYHCTSGRDRTGFASAVLLLALGASRETVAEDYVLSNRYRRDLSFQIGGIVEEKIMSTLTQAHPDYLAAAFGEIDRLHGDDEAYLREALGLTPQRRQLLQDLLLEPKP